VIEDSALWRKYLNDPTKSLEILGDALTAAFIELDKVLYLHQQSVGDISGCTSVTCMVTPTHYVCANAGDSRCVLGRGKHETDPMSNDHKPQDSDEKRRIEKAGGCVQWGRVDGDLAVSRGFGDFAYKRRNDLPPHEQKVTCIPDIKIIERSPEDDVLILACDGLWDVMSSSESVLFVRDIFRSGERDMKLVAEEMLDLALDKGSKDNISAIVIRLSGAELGPVENGGILERRRQREVLAEQNSAKVTATKGTIEDDEDDDYDESEHIEQRVEVPEDPSDEDRVKA